MRKRELDENNRAIRAIVCTSIVALSLVAGCGKVGSNNPPRAEAGSDQNNVAVGTEVTLDASASSDPDGDPLTFAWKFRAIPPESSLSDLNILNSFEKIAHFTPDKVGTYILDLEVSDGSATVTDSVRINVAGTAGILQFSSATCGLKENGGSVTISVNRAEGSSGTVGVIYATGDGTAIAGSDYAAKSGSLSWGDGDTVNKSFSVAIIDDGTYEGDETFKVTLSNPTGGAALGSDKLAIISILENDPPGVVDQKQLLVDTSRESGIGGTSQQKLAQVVTAGMSALVVAVRMPISWTNSGSLLMEIQGVTASMPNGTVLTSEIYSGADFPGKESDGFRSFVFSTPVTLTAGDMFAIVLSEAGGQGGILCGPQGDPYPGGDAFYDARPNKPGWVKMTTRLDLPFETIVLIQ
jgi:hypothetical protein